VLKGGEILKIRGGGGKSAQSLGVLPTAQRWAEAGRGGPKFLCRLEKGEDPKKKPTPPKEKKPDHQPLATGPRTPKKKTQTPPPRKKTAVPPQKQRPYLNFVLAHWEVGRGGEKGSVQPEIGTQATVRCQGGGEREWDASALIKSEVISCMKSESTKVVGGKKREGKG